MSRCSHFACFVLIAAASATAQTGVFTSGDYLKLRSAGGAAFSPDGTHLSYTVTKVGATWDFGKGLTAGAYYKGTDAERAPYTIQGRDWSKDRFVAFVAYAF